jgi:hypothetical protein
MVHLEILVEDRSGQRALEDLVPKVLAEGEHSFRIHSYRGIAHIPKNMRETKNASKRILLENLPKLLRGYGRTFIGYPRGESPVVIVLCDLDDKDFHEFLQELQNVLASCDPAPPTRFCLAIEEGEAWFLGDLTALRNAYQNARNDVLESYVNDSICGTWELLADAIYPGGAKVLISRGSQAVGAEKYKWAETISPKMDPVNNDSPSFCHFRDVVRELTS